MIIDSSALIAILNFESDAEELLSAMDSAERCWMAAPTYLEACQVVIGRKAIGGQIDIDELARKFDVQIVAFDKVHAQAAVAAFVKFGKGRNHPAQLNFGDCISYAVSKIEMMPLLFKGDDFRHTDVDCAI